VATNCENLTSIQQLIKEIILRSMNTKSCRILFFLLSLLFIGGILFFHTTKSNHDYFQKSGLSINYQEAVWYKGQYLSSVNEIDDDGLMLLIACCMKETYLKVDVDDNIPVKVDTDFHPPPVTPRAFFIKAVNPRYVTFTMYNLDGELLVRQLFEIKDIHYHIGSYYNGAVVPLYLEYRQNELSIFPVEQHPFFY